MEKNKKIVLPKNVQIKMIKFFLNTSVPRMLESKN